MTRLSSALLVFSTILLTACSESASPPCADTEPVRALTSTPILRLEYGTSFGYCIGYCKTWIEASEGGVMYTKNGLARHNACVLFNNPPLSGLG